MLGVRCTCVILVCGCGRRWVWVWVEVGLGEGRRGGGRVPRDQVWALQGRWNQSGERHI